MAAGADVGVRLLDAGDAAVTIEFGSTISPELVAEVAALEQVLDAALVAGLLAGVTETVPTFRSLTVLYDPLVTSRAELDPVLHTLLRKRGTAQSTRALRRWRLPVRYGNVFGNERGTDFGADLADVAAACGLSPDAVVEQHAGTEFTVYMLGFMPGFPFMGSVPEALNMPRRAEPRVRVPAGSVAITGKLTAIYPWESPGGWQLLGRCPVPLFNPLAASPFLLAPGDRVRFEPVSSERFAELDAALRHGELQPETFMGTPP